VSKSACPNLMNRFSSTQGVNFTPRLKKLPFKLSKEAC
jgi:hypothetical protein